MYSIIRTGLPAFLVLSLMAAPALAQSSGTGTTETPTAVVPAAPAAPSEKQFDMPRIGNKDTQVELISGLCGIQLKHMSPMACKCLAKQALTGLSDPQRDYMIATVVAPPVADRMLADHRVAQVDQQAIFAFLNATSEACATGTFDASKPAPAMPAGVAPAAPAAQPAPTDPAAPAKPAQ